MQVFLIADVTQNTVQLPTVGGSEAPIHLRVVGRLIEADGRYSIQGELLRVREALVIHVFWAKPTLLPSAMIVRGRATSGHALGLSIEGLLDQDCEFEGTVLDVGHQSMHLGAVSEVSTSPSGIRKPSSGESRVAPSTPDAMQTVAVEPPSSQTDITKLAHIDSAPECGPAPVTAAPQKKPPTASKSQLSIGKAAAAGFPETNGSSYAFSKIEPEPGKNGSNGTNGSKPLKSSPAQPAKTSAPDLNSSRISPEDLEGTES